jgi:drug/metabolite transporter (DMT)-like permease
MAVIDRLWFGIRLPLGAAAGIGTGLVGVGILAGPSGNIDPAGAIVLLLASFAWALGSAYARVAPLPKGAFAGAAMQMLCAGAALGVLGLASGERVHVSEVSGASLAALALLIVFGSLIAFTAYFWLLQHASSTLLSTYAYVNPVVAVFLGWAFVGERVGGREIVRRDAALRPRVPPCPRGDRRVAPAVHPRAGSAGRRVPSGSPPRRAPSRLRLTGRHELGTSP